MKLPKNIKSLGFTLVELMVVISIISVLAATGAVVYSDVNRNNRDAARQRDLNNIKQALEFYFQTHNTYPANKYKSISGGSWIPELIPTYFDVLPKDPNNSDPYFYTYQPSLVEVTASAVCPNPAPAASQFYILYAILEGSSSTTTPPSLNGCSNTGAFTVTITPKTYYLLSQ